MRPCGRWLNGNRSDGNQIRNSDVHPSQRLDMLTPIKFWMRQHEHPPSIARPDPAGLAFAGRPLSADLAASLPNLMWGGEIRCDLPSELLHRRIPSKLGLVRSEFKPFTKSTQEDYKELTYSACFIRGDQRAANRVPQGSSRSICGHIAPLTLLAAPVPITHRRSFACLLRGSSWLSRIGKSQQSGFQQPWEESPS
jgi:hypothetical protein